MIVRFVYDSLADHVLDTRHIHSIVHVFEVGRYVSLVEVAEHQFVNDL